MTVSARMVTGVLCAIVVASVATPAMAQNRSAGIADTAREDVEARAATMAEALIAKMTLEEKVGQLVNVAPAIPRLNIPAYNWWTESLHGAIGTVPTTNFPEPIGLAATFDAPLIHQLRRGLDGLQPHFAFPS